MADGDIEVNVNANDNASGILDGIAQGIQIAFGEKLLEFVGGAFTFVTDQLSQFVSEAGEAEEVAALFNSVLDGSPLRAYGDELSNLASELEKTTRFEDEAILSAETVILRYSEIGYDLFPRVTAASLDLAESMKTTADGGAQMLGRALADIANGSLSALKRTKLLSQETIDQAEAMAKAGDAAGAQEIILSALEKKIGNVAETMGTTFNGAIEKFGNSMGNIREELGAKLLPLLSPLVSKFQLLAEKYAPMLGEMFDKFLVPSLQGMIDKLNPLIDNGLPKLMDFLEGLLTPSEDFLKIVKDITSAFDKLLAGDIAGFTVDIGKLWIDGTQAFENWVKGIDWTKISQDLAAGIESIDFALLASNMVDGFLNILVGIGDFFARVDWGALLGAGFGALQEWIYGSWYKTWELIAPTVVPLIVRGLDIINRTIATFLPNITNTFKFEFDKVKIQVALAMAAIALNIETEIATITTNFRNGLEDWVSAVSDNFSGFVNAGQGMVQAIMTGIENKWSTFSSWISAKIQAIIDSLLGAIGLGGTGLSGSGIEFSPTAPAPNSSAPGGSARPSGGGVTYNFGPVTQNFSGKPNTSIYGAG